MYEQRDTSVPRKHQADYRDGGNWGTNKTRNIHRVVYNFNPMLGLNLYGVDSGTQFIGYTTIFFLLFNTQLLYILSLSLSSRCEWLQQFCRIVFTS